MDTGGYSPRAITDAHHHLWELSRFPYTWLAPDAPPRPFGDHTAIKRDFLPDDYRRATGALPVVASVHVHAECGARDPVGETAWLNDLSRATGTPDGAVFFADLAAPGAPGVLEANAAYAVARGVRAPVSWQPSGRFSFARRPGVMADPVFLETAALLPGLGLSLDMVVLPAQMPEVAQLAAHLPDLSIVINHLGTAEPDTAEVWHRGLAAIAPHDNIAMKVSGLWTIARDWSAPALAPFVMAACEKLGAARLLYGSNAPIDPLHCSMTRQVETLCAILKTVPQAEKDLIFHGTAQRLYRLG